VTIINYARTRQSYTSQYLGVHLNQSGKWSARIRVNGKRIELGRFDSEEEAARNYNNAAILHHGVFATVNILQSEPRKETREGL
jgi:hypothetical protein